MGKCTWLLVSMLTLVLLQFGMPCLVDTHGTPALPKQKWRWRWIGRWEQRRDRGLNWEKRKQGNLLLGCKINK